MVINKILKNIRLIFLVLLGILSVREILRDEYLKSEFKYRWHNFYELKKETFEDKVLFFSKNMNDGIDKFTTSFNEKIENRKLNKEQNENYEDSWVIRVFNSSLMIGLVLVAMYKTVLNLIKVRRKSKCE